MENLSHQHRTRYVYDTRCPIHPTWIGCNIRKNSSPDHPVCSPQSLSSAALGPHAASMISCRMPPRPEKISYEKYIADTTFSYPCLHASGRNRKTAIFFFKKKLWRDGLCRFFLVFLFLHRVGKSRRVKVVVIVLARRLLLAVKIRPRLIDPRTSRLVTAEGDA